MGHSCLDPNVFGYLPMCPIPHTFICSPVYLYKLGVIACTMGEMSHMLGAGGLQHICKAFGVCQYIHWMSIMLHLVPFM